MPRPIEELRLDVEELKRLSELTSRQSVKDTLSVDIRRFETEISLLIKDNAFNVETKPLTNPAPRCYDVKLTKYAWDQSDKYFKIFISLNNIQKLDKEKVSCVFNERSIEFKAKEMDGKNYSLIIKNLAEEIDPAKSYMKIKTDSVVVFLSKVKQITWPTVTAEEKKSKEYKAPVLSGSDISDDPNASLMNMMKQLYDSGDDDMKRQIAKSFAEGRNKQADLGL